MVSAITAEHVSEGFSAMKLVISSAVAAKNMTVTKDGFTPNQRLFGSEIKFPSLTEDNAKPSFAEALDAESDYARAHRMRICARLALIRLDVQEKMKRAILRKPPHEGEVRAAKAVASARNWSGTTFDVTTAFLSGKSLERKVYIRAPREGLPPAENWDPISPGELLQSLKSAYGLTESPRLWYLLWIPREVPCISLRETPEERALEDHRRKLRQGQRQRRKAKMKGRAQVPAAPGRLHVLNFDFSIDSPLPPKRSQEQLTSFMKDLPVRLSPIVEEVREMRDTYKTSLVERDKLAQTLAQQVEATFSRLPIREVQVQQSLADLTDSRNGISEQLVHLLEEVQGQHSMMLATSQTQQSLSVRFDELEAELQGHAEEKKAIEPEVTKMFASQETQTVPSENRSRANREAFDISSQAFAPMSLPSSLPSSLPNVPSFSSFPSSHWPLIPAYTGQMHSPLQEQVRLRFECSLFTLCQDMQWSYPDLIGSPSPYSDGKVRVAKVLRWLQNKHWMHLPFDKLILKLEGAGIQLSMVEQDILKCWLTHGPWHCEAMQIRQVVEQPCRDTLPMANVCHASSKVAAKGAMEISGTAKDAGARRIDKLSGSDQRL
eukprot:s3192_g7.t1